MRDTGWVSQLAARALLILFIIVPRTALLFNRKASCLDCPIALASTECGEADDAGVPGAPFTQTRPRNHLARGGEHGALPGSGVIADAWLSTFR